MGTTGSTPGIDVGVSGFDTFSMISPIYLRLFAVALLVSFPWSLLNVRRLHAQRITRNAQNGSIHVLHLFALGCTVLLLTDVDEGENVGLGLLGEDRPSTNYGR